MRPRQCSSESSAAIDLADRPTASSSSSREMIEQQQQQQQQIMNSIMIANRNKYFSHQQVHHPQSSIGSSLSLVTKNSPSKMSNPGVSGATNSVAAMMNNNNKAAPQATTNGMSSTAHTSSAMASGVSVASPASPQQPQATANKMGSRRIFSPHFKIQVLESYRNDSDCKGNQRATARKYGIHRRQIQKWLQCETALRTSVSSTATGGSSSSSSGSSSNGNSPPSLCKAVDSNNNNPQKRSKAVPVLSTSSNHQARHSVDSSDATHTHARPNSMEFFSLTTTSLIINGGAAGGPDGARKIESMNEAAVPIKPEFGASSASTSSPHPSSVGSRSGVEIPSTAAAAMFKHQHHDLYQHHHQTPEEDAPHHSLISPFISTIYGPQGLLAFPTPRLATAGTYPFDYPVPHHLSPAIPIDLSMGNAERRHSGGDLHFRHSPLIHIDDARVPSRSVSGEEVKPSSHAAPLSPIDLSCGGRKRKAVACPAEPVKPPKLFKPYLLDEDEEEEEELKVVDDDTQSTASTKEDSFLDQDLTGLKDKHSRRFENPIALWSASQQHRHQYYAGSSPAYESLYYGHENLTLYPSPRTYRYESQASLSPSTTSSPLHHPSRPASLFDSSTSSEMAFGNYHHPSSPASSDVPASPPVFSSVVQPLCSSNWAVQEMRSHIGSVF